jgi:predicted AAA+ superfamily ATPase
MIERHYGYRLRQLLAQFPVVTILGPRQCGKTTFIRQTLPNWTYLDLERPSHAAPIEADPEARIEQLGGKVIFDEAQRVPKLFTVLRSAIDGDRRNAGRYILLGSASPSLVGEISESLAGRTGFVDLAPLRWDEVASLAPTEGVRALWLRGGFPDAFLAPEDTARHDWHESYARAFIERDLPAMGIEVSPSQMRKLWTMLAHLNSGIWNASQIAASMGISYHTVNRYLDILEQTFLIRRLPPFFVNIGKRLVKSPKVYFRDTGLLHYFLGIRSASELETHPQRGASWEAFIIDQLIAMFDRVAPGSRYYFWRTARGDEVDLLVDAGDGPLPIEIKLSSAPNAQDASGLRRCMNDLGLQRGWLVYPGDQSYSLGGNVMAVPAALALSGPVQMRI